MQGNTRLLRLFCLIKDIIVDLHYKKCYLQMQHAVLDLGGAALVPELGADVAAGAAGNV